ncbi:hypothetical protein TNCT_523971 [Trichonephila clavata]|uniref:Uncharacterized protein n=1 Tax=Trichonephila clavata TaxID=2740835 RepID=A0A8X6JIV2_TRICU|nr:hypothetical protein TNCT_523971 [Trichonephila clavata]
MQVCGITCAGTGASHSLAEENMKLIQLNMCTADGVQEVIEVYTFHVNVKLDMNVIPFITLVVLKGIILFLNWSPFEMPGSYMTFKGTDHPRKTLIFAEETFHSAHVQDCFLLPDEEGRGDAMQSV